MSHVLARDAKVT